MILSPIFLNSLAAVSVFIGSALCQQKRLGKVVGFGVNPTRLEMFTYVPAKVATKPPIILMVSTSIQIS
jgi:poly(3-hydroxybutyrate) depolymerase